MNDQVFRAIALFLAITLVLILFAARGMGQRGDYSRWEFFLYSLAYSVCRGLWRVQVEGSERLLELRASGAILVANHRSSIDPFLIQLAAGRRVHWMVASEYCKHLLFGPLLRLFQVIPTNRGGVDTASTKQAIRLAASGRLVGMFPEGRINRTAQPLLTIRPGAGLVALKAKVPIVPIWIEGSPRASTVWGPLLKAARVQVRIGSPLPMTSPENDHAIDDHALARDWLSRAMKHSCELGDFEDFEVQFAGKKWVQSN